MLFPELAPCASGFVGIARLAERSKVLEQKCRVEYREIETRRFIGRASGRPMPFQWTVNPYRGCEFGCRYCYARYTHEFMEFRETEQFERIIFAKRLSPEMFRRELSRIPRADAIAVGTATDPYQPAERRYETTRRILKICAGDSGRRIGIATKSDLVARDADVLADIALRNSIEVHLTITTMDDRLARVLEPYAPHPGLRLRAVETLVNAGVPVSVLACPVMPLINDSYRSLSAVAAAAGQAGARYIHGHVLFLKPCAQKAFFPMLEEHFPHLVRRYRDRYETGSGFLRGPYVDTIAQRMKEIRARYGLDRKPAATAATPWTANSQLELFSA